MGKTSTPMEILLIILVTAYLITYAFALATLLVLGVPEFGSQRKEKPQHPMVIIARGVFQKLLWIPIFVSPQLIFVALYIANRIEWWNERMEAYRKGYED